MKRTLSLMVTLLICTFVLNAQDQQTLVSSCALGAGENTTFMKDIVVRLPQAAPDAKEDPVHKVNILLAKNLNYRFTMCNANSSEGELYVTLYDKQKQVTSSYIVKTGKVYSALDFACNKTGTYQLWYSFKDGMKGNGVGIVSLVK